MANTVNIDINDKIKFTKKTITIPESSELGDNAHDKGLDAYCPDVSMLIKEDEKIIIRYIERTIMTSTLSQTTKTQLETMFKSIRAGMNIK